MKPTTNSQQTTNNGSQADEKVRGITKLLAAGDRPKPYGVQWRVDGERKTEFFAEEAVRDRRFLALAADRMKGALYHALTRQEVAEYRAMKATFGQADWREIYNGYIAYSAITNGHTPGESLTVQEACSRYLEEQEKRLALHKASNDTIRHKRTKLRRFGDTIGRLALEAFAGIRFGCASRLEIEDINFVDRGINLPAHKLKTVMTTGRRHYIDGLPDSLWEWLNIATPDTWTLSGSEWMHIITDIFLKARVCLVNRSPEKYSIFCVLCLPPGRDIPCI
jgi:hypothetical protein